jgi:hypothetical protein
VQFAIEGARREIFINSAVPQQKPASRKNFTARLLTQRCASLDIYPEARRVRRTSRAGMAVANTYPAAELEILEEIEFCLEELLR